jgi:hypothetical protein
MRAALKLAITLSLAGSVAAGLSTSSAAGPLPTVTAALSSAAPDQSTQVWWRGGYGPGIGFGFAAGALLGAAVAAPYGGYYGGPYGRPFYGRPVYAAPYGYAPMYSGYYSPYRRYGYYGRCATDEGYGRWRPCSAN